MFTMFARLAYVNLAGPFEEIFRRSIKLPGSWKFVDSETKEFHQKSLAYCETFARYQLTKI